MYSKSFVINQLMDAYIASAMAQSLCGMHSWSVLGRTLWLCIAQVAHCIWCILDVRMCVWFWSYWWYHMNFLLWDNKVDLTIPDQKGCANNVNIISLTLCRVHSWKWKSCLKKIGAGWSSTGMSWHIQDAVRLPIWHSTLDKTRNHQAISFSSGPPSFRLCLYQVDI